MEISYNNQREKNVQVYIFYKLTEVDAFTIKPEEVDGWLGTSIYVI